MDSRAAAHERERALHEALDEALCIDGERDPRTAARAGDARRVADGASAAGAFGLDHEVAGEGADEAGVERRRHGERVMQVAARDARGMRLLGDVDVVSEHVGEERTRRRAGGTEFLGLRA